MSVTIQYTEYGKNNNISDSNRLNSMDLMDSHQKSVTVKIVPGLSVSDIIQEACQKLKLNDVSSADYILK